MSIKNSYDGAISKHTTTDSLNYEITKALLRGQFPCDPQHPCIKYVTDSHADIDSFIHPYWRSEDDSVYIDARGFSTINSMSGLSFRTGEDFDMWMYRAKLELAWIRGNREDIFTAFQFANEVFVRWLTAVIKDKYRLSPIHESKLLVCVALFNIGRYFDKIEGFRMVEKYAQQITSIYRIDADIVFEIVELCGDIFPRNVDEFLNLVQAANVSPALIDLNRLTFFNSLGGSFFMVSNAVQIVSLGIEYPPAFASLVLMAFRHSAIKNKTLIGKRAQMMSTGKRDVHFMRACEIVIDRYIDNVSPGRKLSIGNEGVGTVAAAVGGGCVLIAFIAWIIETVFGGDSSPSKKSEKAVEDLTKAIGDMKSSSEIIKQAYSTIKDASWPEDSMLEGMGEENKKIWNDLSSSVKMPGVKLAIFNFAKAGGTGSSIVMGPVKYSGGDVSKFKSTLQKANQWINTTFAGTEENELQQAVISSLLANRPFPITTVNNPQSVELLSQGFAKLQEIFTEISNAENIDMLTAVQSKITAFNTEIQTSFSKATPDAQPSVVGGVQGATGIVTAHKATRNQNIQLFLPSTGDFNEAFLNEHVNEVKKLVELHSDPNKILELAKTNLEACNQLSAMAKEYKGKTDQFNKLGEKLSGFSEEDKNTEAFKTAETFIKGKNELMTYTTDVINTCNNTALSLQALAKVISSMVIELTSKQMNNDAAKANEDNKPEEKPAEENKADNQTGDNK